jgi:hypothetical protein
MIIKFSESKRYTGTYENGIVEIVDNENGKVVFKKECKEYIATDIIKDEIHKLEEKQKGKNLNEKTNMIDEMIVEYEKTKDSSLEIRLKTILFFMKKMEYVNKKVYHVAEYIEKLENIGIKLEKGWSPFNK